MGFKLGDRSLKRLEGVHPDLVRVVKHAIGITLVDFTVIEGLRSKDRQAELFASGASKTMNSRHLTGHAVDLGAWVDGTVSWDWKYYPRIYEAMLCASEEEHVPIVWGGNWKKFKDGPHFELSWRHYL